MRELEACLPPELAGPTTTIAQIAGGMSGAGVYRVEAAGRAYVLKLAAHDDSLARWRSTLAIQRAAAAAGLAPAVVHADEARRAVLSAFVADRSFMALYMNPQTRAPAVALLGRTLRRVHALPLPSDATSRDPRALLAELSATLALPAFARTAVDRVLAEAPPDDARAPVLGHNDLNPTNLVFDGESIVLLDWQTAGPMHPSFDAATIAMFLRMDDATCRALLAAYDGAPVDALPARFAYGRRLAAAACGAVVLDLARTMSRDDGDAHAGDAPSLGEVYQQMRTGALDLASAAGQRAFGLALLRESLAL